MKQIFAAIRELFAYSVTSLAKSFEKYHKVYLQQPLTINHQFKTDIQKLGSLPT